jgi:phage-related protein
MKKLPVWFFSNDEGRTPVVEWLSELSPESKKRIGRALQTIEFGWPIGMPLCRSIVGYKGLWEVRINLSGGETARLLSCVYEGKMVVLHAFIKKSQ